MLFVSDSQVLLSPSDNFSIVELKQLSILLMFINLHITNHGMILTASDRKTGTYSEKHLLKSFVCTLDTTVLNVHCAMNQEL